MIIVTFEYKECCLRCQHHLEGACSCQSSPKLILCDVDGTLTEPFNSTTLLPRRAAQLVTAHQIALVTNQGGVACHYAWGGNFPDLPQATERLDKIKAEIETFSLRPVGVYASFAFQQKTGEWLPTPKAYADDPQWSYAWRKPNNGMILQAMQDYAITDPYDVVMVGDSWDDYHAAMSANVCFIWADLFFGSADDSLQWHTLSEAAKVTGLPLTTAANWVTRHKVRSQPNYGNRNPKRNNVFVHLPEFRGYAKLRS